MTLTEIDTSGLALTVQRGPPTAASSHAHLQVYKERSRLDVIILGGRDVTLLGRNSRLSHILLDHGSISRRHAALVHNGDGDVYAVDLGSTHGTYLNGCKLPAKGSSMLSNGDVLKFGESSRSYLFSLSAPPTVEAKAVGAEKKPSSEGLAPSPPGKMHGSVPRNQDGVIGKANGDVSSPPGSRGSSNVQREPKARVATGQHRERESQAKSAEGQTRPVSPFLDMDEEREAMSRANLPSSFGAMRDKPLGKKRDRIPIVVHGGMGAVISVADKRFVTAREGDHDANKAGGALDEEHDARKKEERRRRAAEIAKVTAELAQASAQDGAPQGDVDGNGASEDDRNGGVHGRSGVRKGTHDSGAKARGNAKSTSFPARGTGNRPEERDSSQEEQGEEEEEEEEDEGDDMVKSIRHVVRRLGLPVSHEVELRGHAKGVTALALDRAGGRVATGSHDYKVKLFDFGGMDRRHLPFREVEPEEGNVVVSLSYSGTGHAFLVCTAGSQPKVYDRDGNQLAHFVRGDPYIKDMANTKGHVTRVTGGDWHPSKRNEMLTCSVDGTVRIWDLRGKKSFDNLMCNNVVKLRSARGLKLGCTTAVYHQEGKRVAAGGEDGSLHLISLDRPHLKHDVVRDAHTGNALTSVSFNDDGHLLATRAMDDMVKLWDIRKLNGGVVKAFPGVSTHLETANTSFAPDGRVLVCGTNVNPKAEETGTLMFFDVYNAQTSAELEVNVAPNASVARVVWHRQTNQITCSTSAGAVRVLYDPAISDKGAMLSAGRSHGSRVDMSMFVPKHMVGEVYNPHALPMYREERNSKKRKERSDRKDPVKSKKPEPPMPGRGVQGRVSSSYNFHQYVLKEHLVSQKNLRHEDPREELLKYDEETKKDPAFMGGAYGAAEPKEENTLHDRTLEQEEEDFKQEQKKLLDS